MRFALAALLLAKAAGAQQTIPIRPLGPIVAKSTEVFTKIAGVRGLPGGRVVVNDPQGRRLWVLDSALAKVHAVADTVTATGTVYPPRGGGIIKFSGDSTIFVDITSQSMLVLGPLGTVERVMAPPRAQDLSYLIVAQQSPLGGPTNGLPGFDAQGRLIYRTNYRVLPKPAAPGQPQTIEQPDTAPLVRASFETRVIDTIATFRIPIPGREKATQTSAGMKSGLTINPIQVSDEWSVLSDGSVAIVRALDYHIDWIDPDGTRRSTPKMPFDWRRLTDEEKQHYADSALTWLQNMVDSVLKSIPPGATRPIIPDLAAAPINEIPDYIPPIGALRPDLDGNLWILPTTSLQAKNGKLYDVVNRKGEIIERVQFPPGRLLEGFGPGGVVYLSLTTGNQTYLERAHIR